MGPGWDAIATPLDPFFEAFQADPVTGLVLMAVAVFFLLGPEILVATIYLRPVLAARLRKDNIKSVQAGEWDEALTRVVKPLEVRIQEVRDETTDDIQKVRLDLTAAREEVATFYADFAEFSKTLGADLEALPLKIQMRVYGAQGESQKLLQTGLVENAQEFEGEVSMMEAVASEDPEAIIGTAMRKVANWAPSKKMMDEHEMIALAAEIGKPVILDAMYRFYQGSGGTPGRGRSAPGRKALPSPFGG